MARATVGVIRGEDPRKNIDQSTRLVMLVGAVGEWYDAITESTFNGGLKFSWFIDTVEDWVANMLGGWSTILPAVYLGDRIFNRLFLIL